MNQFSLEIAWKPRLFHFLEVGVHHVFLFALASAIGPRRAAIAAGRSLRARTRPALTASLTGLAIHCLGEVMRSAREGLGCAIEFLRILFFQLTLGRRERLF